MQRLLIREISTFHVNPVVKAYIIADTILWSAWNLFNPILAIFVVSQVRHGDIEAAASAYSTHLISRVIFELMCARYLINTNDRKKFQIAVIGMLLMSISYFVFAFSTSIFHIIIAYIISGMGIGIATPAKSALFATHLDKHREATEWGITDAVAFICIAVATTLGGIIAKTFGFSMLFLLAAVLNLIGTLPYVQFLPIGKKLFLPMRGEQE